MATQRKTKVTSLEEIKELIRQHKPELKRQFKVQEIGIYGSYSRGTANKRSDLDLLVKLDEPISYFELAGLKIYIEEITGLKSDVVPFHNLRPEFRENVYKEVIYV
jgi:predicted nucleotidyltransferase